jgi:hypothetical protein
MIKTKAVIDSFIVGNTVKDVKIDEENKIIKFYVDEHEIEFEGELKLKKLFSYNPEKSTSSMIIVE